MEKKESNHDFLAINDLESFNDKVKRIVLNEPPEREEEVLPEEEIDTSFNPEKYESITINPSELTDELLHQLADIIDKKTTYNTEDLINIDAIGNTTDTLLASLAVVYIAENTVPVAVASVSDPTLVNNKGVIPSDFFELKSGVQIENRLQMDSFTIIPEKMGQGLDTKLNQMVTAITPSIFYVNPNTEDITKNMLAKNGYKLASTFETEWEKIPQELWVN